MEKKDPNPETTPKDEPKRRGAGIIIILQTIAIIALAWLYWSQTQKTEKEINEKIVYIDKSNAFSAELATLKDEYQNLKTEDEAIKAQLEEKIAQIEELEKQAAKHKNDAYIIAKLKKEANTLRDIMKGYVKTIDSLNTLNQEILAQKAKVEGELTEQKGKNEELSKEKNELKNVVAMGSALNTRDVIAKGIRMKSGGKKESETDKAKKVEKLKVVFLLAENRIAKEGNKDIYVRVLSPDGKELSKSGSEEEMFELPNGTRSFFAAKKTIKYNKSDMMVSIVCESKDPFIPGKYIIMLFNNGVQIGQTTAELD